MGEAQGTLFSPNFNRSIHVEARPERLSADGGALLIRELMERLGYRTLFRKHLVDLRTPARVTHPFDELLHTLLLLLAQGWSDHIDVQRLRNDPILRLAVSSRHSQRTLRAASGCEPEDHSEALQAERARVLAAAYEASEHISERDLNGFSELGRTMERTSWNSTHRT